MATITPQSQENQPGNTRLTSMQRFDSGSNVVFFGKSVTPECQRCGAFSTTNRGHKYCAHVTCPLALKEFKRRKRKRTSSLEKVYMPRMKKSDRVKSKKKTS